jgi:hypothetical protein
MTILQMKLSWAQQLSCCTCLGGVESADGSWGIGYCLWWSHSWDPPWGYHVGLCSGVRRCMRSTTPQHPCRLFASVHLTMLWSQCVVFLSHIL